MTGNLFRLRFLPNYDGSEGSTALTNANSTFVHTYLGDDNTGDGTREKPYRSITKASTRGGTYIVFRGLINEYFSIGLGSRTFVGDDINQVILGTNYAPYNEAHFINLTTDYSPVKGYSGQTMARVITSATKALSNPNYGVRTSGVICTSRLDGVALTNANLQNYGSTFIGFSYYTGPNLPGNNSSNNIYIADISPANASSGYGVMLITYCVFSTKTAFCYYNGTNTVPISPQPAFVSDPIANMGIMKAAYIAGSSYTSAVMAAAFPVDSFGNETCKIVNETRVGGSAQNIFNQYEANVTTTMNGAITAGARTTLTVTDASNLKSSGFVFVTGTNGSIYAFRYTSRTSTVLTGPSQSMGALANLAVVTQYGYPIDYSLNPDTGNIANFASSTGGYVGALRPAVDGIINQSANIIDVNADGTDTANAGTLLQINASGNLVFNNASAQTWNRFRDTSTVIIPNGSAFKGLSATSTDGSPFGNYIGKAQNLIDTTVVNYTDALTPGHSYKVFNDSSKDITKAIVYNGIQYLPEYTFTCLYNVTSFTLLNAGSGTYLKRILADVVESIEILPYDDVATPSVSFPKFSAPLMGDCKLIYYTAAGATRYGKTAGTPVIFSDLSIANMVADFPRVNDCWLTVATTATNMTTITVNSTTGYPSTGVIYVGTTKFTYTSITATTFVGASQTLTVNAIGTFINLVNKISITHNSIYDGYAISNADREFYQLTNPNNPATLLTYFTQDIPAIKFLRREINGHFDLPYDY